MRGSAPCGGGAGQNLRRSPGVWGDRDLIDASGSTSGESRPAARGPHRVGSLPGAPACRSHPAHNRTCTRLCLIVHIPAVFRPQPSKAGLNVSAGSRRAYGAQVLCSQTSCVWSARPCPHNYDLHGAGGTRGDESALPLALSGARSCPLAQPSEIALIERPLAAAVEALDHQLRLLLGEG